LYDFSTQSFHNITGANLEEILELIERGGRLIDHGIFKSNIVEGYGKWKEISLDRLKWNMLSIKLIPEQMDIEKIKSEQYEVDKFIDLFKDFKSSEFEISLGRKWEFDIKTAIVFYPSQERISVEMELSSFNERGSKMLKSPVQ